MSSLKAITECRFILQDIYENTQIDISNRKAITILKIKTILTKNTCTKTTRDRLNYLLLSLTESEKYPEYGSNIIITAINLCITIRGELTIINKILTEIQENEIVNESSDELKKQTEPLEKEKQEKYKELIDLIKKFKTNKKNKKEIEEKCYELMETCL